MAESEYVCVRVCVCVYVRVRVCVCVRNIIGSGPNVKRMHEEIRHHTTHTYQPKAEEGAEGRAHSSAHKSAEHAASAFENHGQVCAEEQQGRCQRHDKRLQTRHGRRRTRG